VGVVFGVPMAPKTVRMVLVEGESPGAASATGSSGPGDSGTVANARTGRPATRADVGAPGTATTAASLGPLGPPALGAGHLAQSTDGRTRVKSTHAGNPGGTHHSVDRLWKKTVGK
jgi:hypothetical protein